jgi:hypothetical protein
MGYMGLKSWMDGDDCAGLVHRHMDNIVAIVKRGRKEKGNWINPSGAVNIGLFNEAYIQPIAKQLSFTGNDELVALLSSVKLDLSLEIEDTRKVSNEEWGGAKNKRMHINAYKRMVKNLDNTLDTLEHYPERRMAQLRKRKK